MSKQSIPKSLGLKRNRGLSKKKKSNTYDYTKFINLEFQTKENLFFNQQTFKKDVKLQLKTPEISKEKTDLSHLEQLKALHQNILTNNNNTGIPINNINYNIMTMNSVIKQNNLQNLLISNLLTCNDNSNLYNQNLPDKINPNINMNYITFCNPNNLHMTFNPLIARHDPIMNQIPMFNPIHQAPNPLFYNNLLNNQNENFFFNFPNPRNNSNNLFMNEIQCQNPLAIENKMINGISGINNSSPTAAIGAINISSHPQNIDILNNQLNRFNDSLFIKNNIYNRIISDKKDDFNPFYKIDHKETNQMIRNQHIDEFLKEKIIEKKEMDRMTCSKF